MIGHFNMKKGINENCDLCKGTGEVEESHVMVGYFPGKMKPCECWYCDFCQSSLEEDDSCNCQYYK
jgi:hypothetical protein